MIEKYKICKYLNSVVPVGIKSSELGIKICAVTAGIKTQL